MAGLVSGMRLPRANNDSPALGDSRTMKRIFPPPVASSWPERRRDKISFTEFKSIERTGSFLHAADSSSLLAKARKLAWQICCNSHKIQTELYNM